MEHMDFLDGIESNPIDLDASPEPSPKRKDPPSIIEGAGSNNNNNMTSKIHGILVAVLSGNNTNSLQEDFALAVSQQLQKLKRNGKRQRPQDNSTEDDDQFVDGLLQAPQLQSAGGQDTGTEVQQQKDALLNWFSGRLFQAESSLQNLWERQLEQAQRKHAAELEETKRKHAAELEEIKKQNAATLEETKRQQQIDTQQQAQNANAQLDEWDTCRIDKAEKDYQVVRQQIRQALGMNAPHLLEPESLHLANFKEAVRGDLLLLRARHLNERTTDKNTIAELEDKVQKLARQSLVLTQQNVNLASAKTLETKQLSTRILELERRAGQQQQPHTFTQNNYLQEAELARYKKIREDQTMEITALQQRVANLISQIQSSSLSNHQNVELLTLRRDAARHQEVLQENEALRQKTSLYEEALRKLQANSNALQQHQHQQVGTSTPNQQIMQALMVKKDEAHLEEIRKLIGKHNGEMKGQRVRMENLADRIKNLTQVSRNKSEELHEMALQVNTLKAQNEAQQGYIEKLRMGAF